MGHVPTHGPNCFKVHSYRTNCPTCRESVIYFECTCGSRIFLVPGAQGETHDCRSARRTQRPSRISRLTGEVRAQRMCPFCHCSVEATRYLSHVQRCSVR